MTSTLDKAVEPKSKIAALRELLVALLHEHQRDGALPTSARFLYYELVQRGQLSKERNRRSPPGSGSPRRTDRHPRGRSCAGDWIVDETRSVDDYTGYPSIRAGVLSVLPGITLDPWRGRPPMILTEARSVAGACAIRRASTAAASPQPMASAVASYAPRSRRCCRRAIAWPISATWTWLAIRSRTTPAAFLNVKSTGRCGGSAWR